MTRALAAQIELGQWGAADLEDTEAGGRTVVVTKWWTRAVVWSSPETMAELEKMRAGTACMVPIEQVLGADWCG